MWNGNPYAPPAATEPDPRVASFDADGLVPAARSTRFFAALIDGLISVVVILPLQYGMGVFEHWPRVELSAGARLAWGLVGFATYAIVNGWFLREGQTVGKKLLDIQIVSMATGRPPGVAKILLLRFLPGGILGQVPFVGPFYGLVDALFIFGDDRRCIHDRIAGTRVVVRPASIAETRFGM